MEYLYKELLVPDLYTDDKSVAQFVESLLEPEIDLASDEMLDSIIETIIPTDDIADQLQSVDIETQADIIKCGTVSPSFFAFYGSKQKPVRLLSDNPKVKPHVDNLLHAGKCMAMMTAAHSIFFRALVYHKDGMVYANKADALGCQRGIHVIGSSIRGNCFVSLTGIDDEKEHTTFPAIFQKITREGKYHYPFGQFFMIDDEVEMKQIIRLAGKIAHKLNLTPHKCLVNFATILKALLHFKYVQ